MKINKAIIIALAAAALIWSPAVSAQTTTPDPDTTSSAELRQAIKERIEETLKDTDTNRDLYLGFLGTVTQVGSTTFSMTSIQGEEKTVQVTSDTAILSGNQNINLPDLVVGNGVTVMGSLVDDLVMEARRIIMSNGNFSEDRHVNLGTITSIGTQELTLQLRGEEQIATWNTNRQTRYEEFDGGTTTRTALEEDQAVLVITDLDQNDQRYIKRVRLLAPVETVATQ